jgi:uncharacterized membrane protein
MSLDPATLAAIIGMALATYANRGGGYWVFRQLRPTPLMRAVLGYIPGTLFVSFVLPGLLAGGLQTLVGGAATLATMVATRSLILSIIAGVGAAWLVWAMS